MTRFVLMVDRGVVRILFVLSIAGIAYGSLYPFTFQSAGLSASDASSVLVGDMIGQLSLGNLLTNVLLFIPYGLFGALALGNMRLPWRLPALLLGGAVFASALQVAQIWLPGRVPTLVDGGINVVGILLGMLLARVPLVAHLMTAARGRLHLVAALPVVLMLCWLGYRLFPFVPAIGLSLLKDGLRPLLIQPDFQALNVFHNAVGWIVFACLWQRCRLPGRWLPALVAAVLLAEVGIADNVLTLNNVIGASIALFLWSLFGGFGQRLTLVVMLLSAMLVVQGLRPYEWGESPFHWLPFRGFLTGSMYVNMLSLLEKCFLYGSLVWLTLEATPGRSAALVWPVLLMLGVEVAQTQLAGRTAEITDPLLCLVFWVIAVRSLGPGSWRFPEHASDVQR